MAQPQSDVSGLHRLPYHPHQIIAYSIQVCFVSELEGEGFQGLSGVVLPAVETPVNGGLDSPPQRGKQRRYQQCRSHDREGGLLFREDDEASL
jgi:hypothetical protein